MSNDKHGTVMHQARNIPLLVGASVLLVLIAVAGFLSGGVGGGAAVNAEPLVALQQVASAALRARAGDKVALDSVAGAIATLREQAARGAPAWAADPATARLFAAGDDIARARTQLVDAGAAVREARELMPRLLAQLRAVSPGASGPGADALNRAIDRFELRSARLQLDLAALAAGEGDARASASRLAESADYMAQVVGGLAGADASLGLPRPTAPDAQSRVAALVQAHGALDKVVRRAVAAAAVLPAANRAAFDLGAQSLLVARRAAAAATAPSGTPWWPVLPALLALLPLVLLFRHAAELRIDAERQRIVAALQRKEADRNQEAILRLLDELSSLADGDLTVQATVTEDITGAIADSINYAVEALRGLVTTINGSAIQLDGAARQTTALAQHLAKASSAQSKQIGSATESVTGMAAFTEEVSGNAERAADVARHSVDVAHKGGDAVRRTIDGMNTIRETIQDTSKRIKRLGESSQEIGNIVELINDIAEQTNILALNASIQASMAGEAGRGFAVVADEVQRLAERAANATKQIEVLVRTIQADTNEAVVSMERSTTDVVGGALLAENAGAALEEIENVSNQIASLVQNISGSSRQQAQASQSITRNMQVLKEISLQTADSTSATSQAISKLAELSTDLRRSVSGFRLPATAVPRREPRSVAAAPIQKAAGFGGS
jgi:twitching motility protein PilJ